MRNEKEKDMNITRINTEYASVKNIWKHRKREREREGERQRHRRESFKFCYTDEITYA